MQNDGLFSTFSMEFEKSDHFSSSISSIQDSWAEIDVEFIHPTCHYHEFVILLTVYISVFAYYDGAHIVLAFSVPLLSITDTYTHIRILRQKKNPVFLNFPQFLGYGKSSLKIFRNIRISSDMIHCSYDEWSETISVVSLLIIVFGMFEIYLLAPSSAVGIIFKMNHSLEPRFDSNAYFSSFSAFPFFPPSLPSSTPCSICIF